MLEKSKKVKHKPKQQKDIKLQIITHRNIQHTYQNL